MVDEPEAVELAWSWCFCVLDKQERARAEAGGQRNLFAAVKSDSILTPFIFHCTRIGDAGTSVGHFLGENFALQRQGRQARTLEAGLCLDSIRL